MRQTWHAFLHHTTGIRKRTLIAAMVATFGLATLGAASPALAISKLQEEFLPFADCPVETAGDCLIANTSSGEFVIGHKTVPINKTITLQGGLLEFSFATQPLVGAPDGNTLSKTPLTVPGGLVGIEALGGEVTATAELAGPPSSVIVNKVALVVPFKKEAAVTLPIKVHLSNEALGPECYIGSSAEPIVLHLMTGTTNPPPPNKPITGNIGTTSHKARGKIFSFTENVLVDNSFSVPAATGCGGALAFLINPIVNLDVGLPAAAGSNTAIMKGSLEEAAAEFVKKYKVKPKKK